MIATIDLSGIAGLAPRYYGDRPYTASTPNLRYIGAEGQSAEGIYNPIAVYGYMSPANDTTKTVTGTTNFLLTSALISPKRFAEESTNTIFFADEITGSTQGQIVKLDTAVDTSLDAKYTIPKSSSTHFHRAEDLIMYQINGRQQIFFTNPDVTLPASDGYIGIADQAFSTQDPDWSATAPVGADGDLIRTGSRLVFVLSDNGFLYVLDGMVVHKIDGGITGGSDGTITANILAFLGDPNTTGGTKQITRLLDAVDLRGRMWIGLHVNAESDPRLGSLDGFSFSLFVGVYVWDRRSSVASMQDFIPIIGVRELKSMHIFQGKVSCFTISTDGYTQFRVWNGNEFEVLITMGKTAYPPYRRHSVHEGGEYIMWLGEDGKIYFYGKFEPELKNALYILGDMTNHVSDGETYAGSGVFIAANATETVTSGNQAEPLAFYLSFKDSAGNHLKKWYPHSTSSVASVNQLSHIGDIYSMVKFLPTLSTVRTVNIRCAPTGTGSGTIATIKYYFNQSSSVGATKTVTKDEASRGYVSHDLNKHDVNSIQIEIEHSITESTGTDKFLPAIAVIEYEPTKTHTKDLG